MKGIVLTVILSLLVSVISLADEDAAPKLEAVLTVEVMNGTVNGSSVLGDEVTVQVYRHGELLYSFDGKVGPNNQAVFEEVPIGTHVIGVVSAKHQEMMFKGRAFALGGPNKNISAEVTVFDVSEDTSALSVVTHHIMIKPRGNELEIAEFMQLVNSSDMAVRSSRRDSRDNSIVLEIKLPKGFENLESSSYFEKGSLVITKDGFYDILAVPPGEYQIRFSYRLRINSRSMDIVKGISLPTKSLVIFAEAGGVKVEGLGEADSTVVQPNGTASPYYKRSNLAAGEEIAFKITGFNVGGMDSSSWVVLAVVFGIVVVFVILRLFVVKK